MIHFIICTLALLAFASLVNSTETLNSTVQEPPQLAPVPIGPVPVPGVFTSKRPTALTNGIGGPRVCWSPADDPGAVWCSFTTDYVTYTHRQMTKSKAAGCSEENYGTAGIAMSPVNDDLNMYLYVCTGANSLAMMSFLDGTPSAPVCLDHFYEAVNCLGSVSALYLLGAPSWIVGFYKHNDGDMWTFRHHPGLGIAGGVSLDPNNDFFKIADAPGLYRKDDTDEVQVFYHKESISSPPQLFRTIYTISTLKFGFGEPLSTASGFSNVPFTLVPRPGRIYFPDKRYVLMYPFTTSTARGFRLDTTYDPTMLTGWSTFYSQTAQQPNTSCSEVVLYQKPTAPYTSWFGCWYANTSGALIWFGLIY